MANLDFTLINFSLYTCISVLSIILVRHYTRYRIADIEKFDKKLMADIALRKEEAAKLGPTKEAENILQECIKEIDKGTEIAKKHYESTKEKQTTFALGTVIVCILNVFGYHNNDNYLIFITLFSINIATLVLMTLCLGIVIGKTDNTYKIVDYLKE